MEGKQATPGEGGGSTTEKPPPDAQIGPLETYGVVQFKRLEKDDGRALIVFSRPAER